MRVSDKFSPSKSRDISQIYRLFLLRTAVRSNFYKMLFACLICVTLVTPSRKAEAIEPATIALVSSLIASAVSLLDSGANPTATATFQNRDMIKQLHARMDKYNEAFEIILGKLDDLPGIIREELETAFAEQQRKEIHGAIRNILDDVKKLEKGIGVHLPATDRIQKFEHEREVLLQYKHDLLLIPTIMEAMKLDLAFHSAREDSEANKMAFIEELKVKYRARLMKTLDPERESSLISKYDAINTNLKNSITNLESYFTKIKNHGVKRISSTSVCETYSMDINPEAEALANKIWSGKSVKINDEKEKDEHFSEIHVKINQMMLNFSAYLINFVRYTLRTSLAKDIYYLPLQGKKSYVEKKGIPLMMSTHKFVKRMGTEYFEYFYAILDMKSFHETLIYAEKIPAPKWTEFKDRKSDSLKKFKTIKEKIRQYAKRFPYHLIPPRYGPPRPGVDCP